MGDLMENLYSRTGKVIAGILGFLTSISVAGLELVVLGMIGEKILNFPAQWTISIGGIILAMYSAHGGIILIVKEKAKFFGYPPPRDNFKSSY